jgi:hypothetical protein
MIGITQYPAIGPKVADTANVGAGDVHVLGAYV